MLKTLTITITFLLCLFSVYAQTTHQIDLGKISKYDNVLNSISYYTDYSKKASIDEISKETFRDSPKNSPFDPTEPDAHYFMKLSVYNSGHQDTFWLYMGRAQQYTMYGYDSSTRKMKTLNNQTSSFSYAIFNHLPYAYFVVKNGERKIFYIQAKINYYNWRLFDPIIVIPEELPSFTFEYFLQPNSIYIFVSVLLLGIMFSLFFSFVSIYFLTFNRDYLYYTLALLCYLVYFFLRIFDNFIFSRLYWFFYDARLQVLQIGGSIFILLFVISFLQIRNTLPEQYKYFRIIVLLQVFFLIINVPITYSNKYHYAGTISFDVLRIFILPYFILLITAVIKYIKTRESRYISWGSLISILLFLVALYADVVSHYKSDYINHREIALLAFTTGILIQMRFFMEAIMFRTNTKNDLHIKALEKLQFENDRKELEKYKAVIDARDMERNRISQEIHDDIGSGLTSIRLLSEIGKARSIQTPHKELEKISAISNSLIDKMNEIVWSLNSRNDTLPNLIAYLRHLMVEYFEPLRIQLQIVTPEAVREIAVDGKTRRHILLSVKEVLHNIVKHSQATEVHIVFSVEETFSVSISDNGIGFNPSLTHSYKNGLQNIKERLSTIGGSCIISNNSGTSIILEVPLL